jgi:hypothetical protein
MAGNLAGAMAHVQHANAKAGGADDLCGVATGPVPRASECPGLVLNNLSTVVVV